MKIKKDWYDEVLVGFALVTFIMLFYVIASAKPVNVFNLGILVILFTNLYFLLKFNNWLKY